MDYQDIFIIAGAVAIIVGLALISLPLGVVGGGAGLITLALYMKEPE